MQQQPALVGLAWLSDDEAWLRSSVFELANRRLASQSMTCVCCPRPAGLIRSSIGISVADGAVSIIRISTQCLVGRQPPWSDSLTSGGDQVSFPSPPGFGAIPAKSPRPAVGAFVFGRSRSARRPSRDTTHWPPRARELAGSLSPKSERWRQDRNFHHRRPGVDLGWHEPPGIDLNSGHGRKGSRRRRGPGPVAKQLVVYHWRAGGQSQFSALLELEPKSDPHPKRTGIRKAQSRCSADGWTAR